MITLEENSKILFIGDSITDCGRSREDLACPGNGYVKFLRAQLGLSYPELDLEFINRGISGNRVKDLKERWDKDCVELKPDVVSIMIGINDTWRRYDAANDPTSTGIYKSDYRSILKKTKDSGAEIIMLEPFVLPFPEDRKRWREDLDPKIAATRELAAEFADAYVPLDGIFATAAIRKEPSYWAADGVHPTLYGHMLIAEAWLDHAGV
jgi:lysophospholipase L1-like esterase